MTPHYNGNINNRDERLAKNVTYDNRCGAEHSGRWANKAIFLVWATEAFNIREKPSLNTKLHCAGNDSRDDLTEEHRAGWNLHVVTKLQVTNES